MPPRSRSLLVLPLAIAVCLGAGRLGSLLTSPYIEGWYRQLEKPFFTPPDLAFPIVWTLLYILMAVAFWLAWRKASAQGETAAVVFPFGIHLLINIGWSGAFFALQSPFLGLVVIVTLIAAILWTMLAFYRFDRTAAYLMLPYLAWVGYATALNAAIWCLNP
jgi:translocator protein